MKLKQSKVFKAGIGYTIGNVMVKGINFLAIPIFSRLLTTEEMGLYTVLPHMKQSCSFLLEWLCIAQ